MLPPPVRMASTDTVPGLAQSILDIGDADDAEMKDACREKGIGAGVRGLTKMIGGACSPTGNERGVGMRADSRNQLEIESVPGAIGVDGVHQDLSDALALSRRDPFEYVEAGRTATSVGGDFKSAGGVGAAPRVDAQHQNLGAEPAVNAFQQIGVVYGRGIEADLIGAGAQQRVDIIDRPHSPADGQGDEHITGRTVYDVDGGSAPL